MFPRAFLYILSNHIHPLIASPTFNPVGPIPNLAPYLLFSVFARSSQLVARSLYLLPQLLLHRLRLTAPIDRNTRHYYP